MANRNRLRDGGCGSATNLGRPRNREISFARASPAISTTVALGGGGRGAGCKVVEADANHAASAARAAEHSAARLSFIGLDSDRSTP